MGYFTSTSPSHRNNPLYDVEDHPEPAEEFVVSAYHVNIDPRAEDISFLSTPTVVEPFTPVMSSSTSNNRALVVAPTMRRQLSRKTFSIPKKIKGFLRKASTSQKMRQQRRRRSRSRSPSKKRSFLSSTPEKNEASALLQASRTSPDDGDDDEEYYYDDDEFAPQEYDVPSRYVTFTNEEEQPEAMAVAQHCPNPPLPPPHRQNQLQEVHRTPSAPYAFSDSPPTSTRQLLPALEVVPNNTTTTTITTTAGKSNNNNKEKLALVTKILSPCIPKLKCAMMWGTTPRTNNVSTTEEEYTGDYDTSSQSTALGLARLCVITLVTYLVMGVVCFHYGLEVQWSVWDCIVFVLSTLSTVGHLVDDDEGSGSSLYPTSAASQVFTSVYTFVGMMLWAVALGLVMGQRLVQLQKRQQRLHQGSGTKWQSFLQNELLRHLGKSMVVLLASSIVLALAAGWDVSTSLYVLVTTASTVGSNHLLVGNPTFIVVLIPLTMTGLILFWGHLAAMVVFVALKDQERWNMQQEEILLDVIHMLLAKQYVEIVTRTEFLQHLGETTMIRQNSYPKMDAQLFKGLQDTFDRLDVQQRGVLTRQDLLHAATVLTASQQQQQRRRRARRCC